MRLCFLCLSVCLCLCVCVCVCAAYSTMSLLMTVSLQSSLYAALLEWACRPDQQASPYLNAQLEVQPCVSSCIEICPLVLCMIHRAPTEAGRRAVGHRIMRTSMKI